MFTGTGRWQMSEACQVKEVSSCRVNTPLEGSIAADSLTDSCCIDTFPCSVATSPPPLLFLAPPLPRFPPSPPSLVHPPSSSPPPPPLDQLFLDCCFHLPFRNWYRLFLLLGTQGILVSSLFKMVFSDFIPFYDMSWPVSLQSPWRGVTWPGYSRFVN